MKIECYSHLFDRNDISTQNKWKDILLCELENIFSSPPHGHFSQWLNTVEQLSRFTTKYQNFDCPIIEIGQSAEINQDDKNLIHQQLKTLLPWRKGPFNFFGEHIDSEWRCDKKWQRVQAVIPPLAGKNILDVGCGNGYYMLRMLGDGAKHVLGVDPTLIFLAQYTALTQNLTHKLNAHLLPIAFEQLPSELNQFDLIFSMGVLYHRRDPLEHLTRLYSHIADEGFLVLETLIIDEVNEYELIPQDRYAGMRNVWSIPSPNLLESWLKQCGFNNIQLHSIDKTRLDEQRSTHWTKNFSLENFLDPNNADLTIEGYPAPMRAILTARKS